MGALDDRLALVTGGSRGIGAGIALRLAAAGAEIVVTGRTRESAASTVAAIEAAGGRARALALDVSDDDSVAESVGGLIKECGILPILVNNAGITGDGLLLRMKPADWDRVVGTNLTGVYRICRTVVPSMVRGRFGRIVNITSVVASLGNAGQTNYAAAKAGIEGFTRSLAREVASRNVTVNCVAPGFIDTDMTRVLDENSRGALMAQIPLGRLGRPEDVAAAVEFLVGPGGDYITGITLNVNGGMHM